MKYNSPLVVLLHEIPDAPLTIQSVFFNDQQEPNTKVPHVNFIYHFVHHVIYSLWICTNFINKILRNQIQYRYISTQVVSGCVMASPSDVDGDLSNWLALSLSVTLSDL